MADINKIREKLAALLSRARDAGSSEAEVAACMQRAEKLMAQYGLSESDLDDVTAKDFREYTINPPEGRSAHDPIVRYLAPAIGRLTSVTFYIDNTRNEGKLAPIVSFGLEADVEYAHWLIKSLRTFMDDQWVDYKQWQLGACTRNELKAERIGFVRGFVDVVAARLKEMTADRAEGGAESGSTSLVVKKNDLVAKALADRGINLGRGASLSGNGRGSDTGRQAGAVAGNSANIGRGVGQSSIAIGDGR
jgi:hypothetical protein